LLYTGQMSWEWLHSELEMFRRKKSQPSLQLKHVRAITGRLDLHCVTCEVAHRPRERVQSKQSSVQWRPLADRAQLRRKHRDVHKWSEPSRAWQFTPVIPALGRLT
jgi:hypothetical protein